MSQELPSRNVLWGEIAPPMEQGLDVRRVLQGVWRRRRICLAVGLVVFALGAATVAATPNIYRATTTVRVEPDRPSPELVKPTVTQPIEFRLKTITGELFARPLLQKVITEQNLYPAIVKEHGLDAAAAEMRRHLDVKVEDGHVAGEEPHAFDLTYENANPQAAAAVANRLPELFAQEVLSVRAQQAQEADDIFADELTKLQKEATAQENRLNAFKMAHLGELPEQLEPNMRGLERLTMLISQRSDDLRDAQRRLVEAQKDHFGADTDAGQLGHDERDLRAKLDHAQSMYTSDHPEVQSLERELTAVHAQRIVADAQARAADTSRAEAEGEVRSLSHELTDLKAQAALYKQRIDDTPRWSESLAGLDRQYEIVKQKYQQMLSRKVEADIARDLEIRSRAHLFHVLAPAEVPSLPVRPDRPAGYVLVGLLALALGILAGVVLELQDDSFRHPADARSALHLPVLAVVPDLGKKPLLGTGKTLRPAINRPTIDA